MVAKKQVYSSVFVCLDEFPCTVLESKLVCIVDTLSIQINMLFVFETPRMIVEMIRAYLHMRFVSTTHSSRI